MFISFAIKNPEQRSALDRPRRKRITMRMPRTTGSALGRGVPLTPLIDVIFLLIIFFLCVSQYQKVETSAAYYCLPPAPARGPIYRREKLADSLSRSRPTVGSPWRVKRRRCRNWRPSCAVGSRPSPPSRSRSGCGPTAPRPTAKSSRSCDCAPASACPLSPSK